MYMLESYNTIILAAAFPIPWLCLVVGIPTNPTSTSVPLPLPPEPPAVGLVVVVVGLGGEAGAPGGDARRWVDEAAVGRDQLTGEEQQEEHQQPHPEQVGGFLLVAMMGK